MQQFNLNTLMFDKNGLIPAIVQDAQSGTVLLVAFMNMESLRRTMETGETHFWSRSRGEMWHKGETSGNIQKVRSMVADCDRDALLVLVDQVGNACHTGEYSCFFDTLFEGDLRAPGFGQAVAALWRAIQQRKAELPSNSYTTHLFQSGIDKVLKKGGEEAGKTIIAAKNHDQREIAWEVSDLVYHLLVLLAMEEVSLDDIALELESRAKGRSERAE